MGKPYSQDLRERVIATVGSGTRVCAAARLFLVSVSYVSKVVERQRTTGETTARVGRAGRKPKLAPHDGAIRARVAAHPDATLEELQAWLANEREVKVSIGCLWNRLKFLKLPLKKSRSEPPSRIGRMSPRHAQEWRASQGELNPQSLVFIDETGAATDMARRYGRCPRGERLLSAVCRGDIGKLRPSLPRCGWARSPRPACSTDRWMGKAFAPMSSSSSCRSCGPAISS